MTESFTDNQHHLFSLQWYCPNISILRNEEFVGEFLVSQTIYCNFSCYIVFLFAVISISTVSKQNHFFRCLWCYQKWTLRSVLRYELLSLCICYMLHVLNLRFVSFFPLCDFNLRTAASWMKAGCFRYNLNILTCLIYLYVHEEVMLNCMLQTLLVF